MKRTALFMATVLMLAIMDFGYVRPGFAQAEDDDFLIVAISGASGQSVRANTAFPEWTWTAPVTGPVTFDTRGTGFDTLLVVFDGDTNVASNFDIGDFNLDDFSLNDDAILASEVRFTAQQGHVYAILVTRFDGSYEPGTIVLNWRQDSPGAGGSNEPRVEDTDGFGLREVFFDDPEPGAPGYVLTGPNASVWYWTTDNTTTQSLYVAADGSVSVRTFYDADGLPYKVLDERTGSWMLIQKYDAKNVDFWFYDEDGTYQSGLAIFEARGQYYYAEIDGEPVHAGKQVTGFLQPAGASWTGSYTLEVDMSMIQAPQPVPQDIAALIGSLSPGGTGRTGMLTGWQSRFAVILKPFGAWLSPGVAVAQPALTVQDALLWGGVAMMVAGGASLAPPVFVTAGAVTFVMGMLAPDMSQERIRSHCPDSPEMANSLCHWAADNLAHPDARGPIGHVRDLVRDVREGVSDAADRGRQALNDIAQYFDPPEPPQDMDEPTPRIPDDGLETVRGTMTDGTTTVSVAGTVTAGGDFEVADDDGEARLDLSIGATDDAPAEGNFEWDGVSGEVGGNHVGHPILVKPIPDWEAPVGATKTIDLSQHFESANDARLTYGDTGNDDPGIATASVTGSTMTLRAHQAGTTRINVTAWDFLDGTSTTGTMRIEITLPSTTIQNTGGDGLGEGLFAWCGCPMDHNSNGFAGHSLDANIGPGCKYNWSDDVARGVTSAVCFDCFNDVAYFSQFSQWVGCEEAKEVTETAYPSKWRSGGSWLTYDCAQLPYRFQSSWCREWLYTAKPYDYCTQVSGGFPWCEVER